MDTVFPTIPYTAAFRLYIYYTDGDRQRYFYPQFNYLLGGPFESTYTYTQWYDDMGVIWHDQLVAICPPDMKMVGVECFYQFGATQMQMPYYIPGFTGTAPRIRLAAAGAAMFLRTATKGKRFTGRTHFPFLTDSDYNGSYLTDSFRSRIMPWQNFLLDSFLMGGVVHRLAVWSRASNIMTPVTSIDYCPRVMYLSHRRIHGDNWAPPMEMYHHGLPPLPP